MNDTIALIFVLVMLGLLSFWSVAQIALFVRRDAAGQQYRMYIRHFKVVPVEKTHLVKPSQVAQKRVASAKTSPLAAQPVATPMPARPVPSVEVAVRPSDIRMPSSFFRDLRDIDFRGRDLVGVNWSHCNLVGVNLSGADLQGAELAYADLTNANLVGANLSECDCTCARFHGANLTGANLRNSNLTDTRFGPTKRLWSELHRLGGEGRYPRRMAEIDGANLQGAVWDGAICTGSDIVRAIQHKELYWTRW